MIGDYPSGLSIRTISERMARIWRDLGPKIVIAAFSGTLPQFTTSSLRSPGLCHNSELAAGVPHAFVACVPATEPHEKENSECFAVLVRFVFSEGCPKRDKTPHCYALAKYDGAWENTLGRCSGQQYIPPAYSPTPRRSPNSF